MSTAHQPEPIDWDKGNEVYVKSLETILAHTEMHARKALAEGNMQLHMTYGRMYHRTADKLLELTGREHRPTS